MNITMLTAGVLGLLLLMLAGYVIAGRVQFKIDLGDGDHAAMRRRVRAQANFIEYVPIALILIGLMENGTVGPRWLVMTLAAILVFARIWHAQGLLSSSGVSAGRFMGTNLTAGVILVAAVACIGRGAGVW